MADPTLNPDLKQTIKDFVKEQAKKAKVDPNDKLDERMAEIEKASNKVLADHPELAKNRKKFSEELAKELLKKDPANAAKDLYPETAALIRKGAKEEALNMFQPTDPQILDGMAGHPPLKERIEGALAASKKEVVKGVPLEDAGKDAGKDAAKNVDTGDILNALPIPDWAKKALKFLTALAVEGQNKGANLVAQENGMGDDAPEGAPSLPFANVGLGMGSGFHGPRGGGRGGFRIG